MGGKSAIAYVGDHGLPERLRCSSRLGSAHAPAAANVRKIAIRTHTEGLPSGVSEADLPTVGRQVGRQPKIQETRGGHLPGYGKCSI